MLDVSRPYSLIRYSGQTYYLQHGALYDRRTHALVGSAADQPDQPVKVKDNAYFPRTFGHAARGAGYAAARAPHAGDVLPIMSMWLNTATGELHTSMGGGRWVAGTIDG